MTAPAEQPRDECADLSRELEIIQQLFAARLRQRDEANAQLIQERKRAEELLSEVTALREENKAQEQEAVEFAGKVEQAMTTYKEEKLALRKEIAVLREANEKLQARQEEIPALQEALQHYEVQIAELQAGQKEMPALREALQHYEVQIAELQAGQKEMPALQESLRQYQAQIVQLQKGQQVIAVLKEALQQSQARIAELQKENEQFLKAQAKARATVQDILAAKTAARTLSEIKIADPSARPPQAGANDAAIQGRSEKATQEMRRPAVLGKDDAPSTTARKEEPAPTPQPPTEERRQSLRRKGNPVPLLIDPGWGTQERINGWVVDRCTAGLGFIVDHELTVGKEMKVRPAKAVEDSWISVVIKHCRATKTGWAAGCEFVDKEKVPYLVRQQFG
jgi:DNA repair exonuclease SbcCD ATPase subunit